MTSLIFQHPERGWLVAVLVLLAALALQRSYRHAPLRGAARGLAPACKLLAWGLLAALVTDPVWSSRRPKTGENEIAVIADNSASLTLAEAPGQPTRAAQMQAALGSADQPPGWLEAISRNFRVQLLLADERLRGVADFSSLDFQGARSELHRALQTVRTGGAGSRLAAVVLVTDGQPTDAAAANATLPAGVPVFPVLVGQAEPAPDLRLTEVSVAQTAFEDTPVTITAGLRGQGFAGREIVVAVLDEAGKTAASEKLKLSQATDSRTVRLQVPVTRPGLSFYRVVVAEAALAAQLGGDAWRPRAQEAVLQNNERLISVDRGQGPYRVLYLAGRPNWEYKFLRRALAGDPEIQLPSLIRIAKREPKFEWRGRTGETSNPLFRGFGQQGEAQRYDQPVLTRLGTRDAAELRDGFPKSAEELMGEYRAIVIDDLEAEFFTQEQLQLIERFVSDRGGALLMLGGQECYQAGGYEHTPVGRMLPVHLDRLSREPPVADGRFNLSREGWLEPWTRLRPARAAEEQRLAQMPGFHAVNQVFSIKPGASVLATIERDSAQPLPALAAHRFGEGRVAALTIADLWRWGLYDEAAGKDLQRSWRQLLRWLVVDVPDRIEFTAAPAAGRVPLSVRVRDRAFRPVDDALVRIEVTGPGGRKSVLFAEPSLREAGLFEAEFTGPEPGAYRAVAEVKASAEAGQPALPLGRKSSGWTQDPRAEEFAQPAPGREWLERLARDSGGELLTLADLPKLPARLQNLRAPVEETVIRPLWHAPWFFALVLGLLGTEWVLRRKGGLP